MLNILFLLVLIGGALLVLVLMFGSITLLIKLGVVAHQASRPVYRDHGTYTLDQGHEVRSEEHQHEMRARDNA